MELEDTNKQRTDHQTYDSNNVNIIIDVDCGVVVSSVCKYVTLYQNPLGVMSDGRLISEDNFSDISNCTSTAPPSLPRPRAGAGAAH